MSRVTYKLRGIVLRKTKLAEKDLIVSLLAEDGSLVQGVAKGARRPGGSLAARLELFSTVDMMLAKGRSLDVICEARLVDAVGGDVLSLEQTACASPLAELLCAISQPGLEAPRVFDMSHAAFAYLVGVKPCSQTVRPAITAAALWKVMAQVGYRPSFALCTICGKPIEDDGPDITPIAVSVADGGAVCGDCRRPADAVVVPRETVRWCDAFIRLRFDEIAAATPDGGQVASALQLARLWARVHTGKNLKSIDFMLVNL